MIDLKAIRKRAARWSGLSVKNIRGYLCITADHPKNKDYEVTLYKAVWAEEEDCLLLTEDIKALLERVGELEARLVKIELKKKHWRDVAVRVYQSADDIDRRVEFDGGISNIEYLLDEEDQETQALAAHKGGQP